MSDVKQYRDDGYNTVEDKPISAANMFNSAKETPTRLEAKASGKIPEWISGDFFRNGPGKFEAGEDKVGHLFDGFAMMHKFEIAEGKVFYSSRYLRGEAYKKAMAQDRLVVSGFGTVSTVPDPCKSIFRRFLSYFQPPEASDNCNVNYVQVGDDFYALTESPRFIKVDPKELETEDKLDIRDYVPVNTASAHPHYGSDHTVYNMGTSFGAQSFYNIIKVPPPTPGSDRDPFEKTSVLCKIPASSSLYPSYYHSFAITPNYIIFLEQPLTLNVFKILFAKFLGRDFVGCIDYSPSSLAKFHVIRLEDGAILPQKYTADAFFCFHHINAFEDDGHLVVDLCAYEDIQVITSTYMEVLWSGNPPRTNALAKRFVLPIVDGIKMGDDLRSKKNLVSLGYCEASAHVREDGSVHCVPETLCGQNVEAPRMNYGHFNGQKYRYFYSLSGDVQKLVKVDTVKKTCKLWEEPSCYPSEPVFVPRPGADDEDDGVVLSSVLDLKGTGRPPFLVILDANTFTELARAEIPADIPFGIHGIFIPN